MTGPRGIPREIVRANINANTIRTTMSAVPNFWKGRVHRGEISGFRMPAQESQRSPAGVCVRQLWQYGVRHRPHRSNVVRAAWREQATATVTGGTGGAVTAGSG
jgi:hypothetical protein